MFNSKQRLILASGSPRRKEYLENAGIEFSVVPATIDESRRHAESIDEYVRRMALEKGYSVASRFVESWIVSADTVVSCGEQLCDKPVETGQAVAQLMQLSGKTHEVRTAFVVWNMSVKAKEVQVVITRVKFWSFTESVARAYVERGESYDKAGGYGIQSGGALLVESIDGSYSNVVGLPMSQVLQTLLRFEVIEVLV